MKKKEKTLKRLNKVLNVYTFVGVALLVIATVILLIPYVPHIWYRFDDSATDTEAETLTTPTDPNTDNSFSQSIPIEEIEVEKKVKLPRFDQALPEQNVLVIPKIGVNGEIHESTNPIDALEKGMWRVTDYGTPEDFTSIIVAAHRFGYLRWTNDFRITNTFYNLPKTGVGDSVEIIWGQRKYEYEIYKVEDSSEIQDYDADLILYTCRLFNSPVRIFRYAERVN